MLDAGGVFKDVGAFGEAIDEEVGGGVACAFVVGEAVLPFVAAEHVDRFGATSPLILHVDKLEVAVGTQFDANHQFISRGERTRDGFEDRSAFAGLLDPEGLSELERVVLVGRDVFNVLNVLPMGTAPGDAIVCLLQGDLSHIGANLVPDPGLLIETGVGFDMFRLNGLASEGHFHQRTIFR